MPTNEELAAAGVLQKGDVIPLGDIGTLWNNWKETDWGKLVINDTKFNTKSNTMSPLSGQLPTVAQLQATSSKLSELSPEFKKWYTETLNKNEKIFGNLGWKQLKHSNPWAYKNKSPSITTEVYRALLTDLENKNIAALDSAIVPRVTEIMTLSPQEEQARLLNQWKTTVLPELSKHKTQFVKEKVALEETLGKAMGSSYLQFSSSKDLQGSIASSTQFMNAQYKSYSDKLGKAMSKLTASALGSLEGLLPQAPELAKVGNTTKMWYLNKGIDPTEVTVNLDTGAWTDAQGKTGNFTYYDPEFKAAMSSGDAEFSKLHLEYQNRLYQRGKDSEAINKHYENLRTYLRGTLSNTLMKSIIKY